MIYLFLINYLISGLLIGVLFQLLMYVNYPETIKLDTVYLVSVYLLNVLFYPVTITLIIVLYILSKHKENKQKR